MLIRGFFGTHILVHRKMLMRRLSFGLIVFLSVIGCCFGAFQGSFSDPAGYSFQWSIQPGSRTISATMHSKLQGWVGFGWHCAEPSCNQDTQMFNVDFVVGLLIGGSWVATDQVSEQGKQTGPPVLDTAR